MSLVQTLAKNLELDSSEFLHLVDIVTKEMVIQDPEKFLNPYCYKYSTLPGIKLSEVNQKVKKELEHQVASHWFTEIVDKNFKDLEQVKKGKLRHKEELTKETMTKRIITFLRKQPKDIVEGFYYDIESIVEPEQEISNYLRK